MPETLYNSSYNSERIFSDWSVVLDRANVDRLRRFSAALRWCSKARNFSVVARQRIWNTGRQVRPEVALAALLQLELRLAVGVRRRQLMRARTRRRASLQHAPRGARVARPPTGRRIISLELSKSDSDVNGAPLHQFQKQTESYVNASKLVLR